MNGNIIEAVIDVETGGLDDYKNGLLQSSGLIAVNGEEKERFNFLIKPFDSDTVLEEALKVNGLDPTGNDFQSPSLVHAQMVQLFGQYVDPYNKEDKMFFVGYNAQFDYRFMRTFFKKAKDRYFGSWFYYPPLDVMNRAAYQLRNRRAKMTNFKLGTVATELGIDVDEEKQHDAMYDVELTWQMYKLLR